MGFLGQELPGSIICAECTCSHTPEPRRAAPTRLPSAAAGRVWPRGCCPPGLFPLPAQKCAPNPRVCGRSGEQPVLPVPALPAPPGWFLERCSRSCPQAGDAERSSSLLEMALQGPSSACCPLNASRLEMCGLFRALSPLQLRPSHPSFCQVFFQSSGAPEEQSSPGEPLFPAPSTSPAFPGSCSLQGISPTPS